MLRAAAVIGRVASVPLLARTGDSARRTSRTRLRPAIDAHVARGAPTTAIGFHHPAFREVVYAELLPGERARLHRAAAEALDAEPAPSPEVVGELARHWHRAGDLERALEASVTRGPGLRADVRLRRRLRQLRPGPRAAGPGAGSDVDRVDLRRAAECAILAGDAPATVARRPLLEALDRRRRDGRTRAGLLERLGSFHFLAGDGEAAETAFRDGDGPAAPGETAGWPPGCTPGYALLCRRLVPARRRRGGRRPRAADLPRGRCPP